MVAAAPVADQATDFFQKLSLDSQAKDHDPSEASKKPSDVQFGSANGGEVSNVPIPPREQSLTPLLQEINPSTVYLPNGYESTTYYYGGYDGSVGEWDNYSTYMNHDGVEMPHGVYGDVYHPGYGYASYGFYPSNGSGIPSVGHDGHLYGPPHYQYPAPLYQPPTSPTAAHTPNQLPSSQGEGPTSVANDQPPLSSDVTNANTNGIANGNTKENSGSAPVKPSNGSTPLTSNGSYSRGVLPGGLPSSGYQDPRFCYDGMASPVPWFDGPMFLNGQQRSATTNSASSTILHNKSIISARNEDHHLHSHMMGLHNPRPSAMGPASPGFMNRVYPNNQMYNHYGTFRTGWGYRSNGYDSKTNSRWAFVADGKYKPRGQVSGFYECGNENLNTLSELNRGPRSGHFKNQEGFGPTITITAKGQTLPLNGIEDSSVATPDKDQYNQADFPENHADAKFFVIKSYSEDDIHKSIKYNVWASTSNGNKKLDAAYQEAKEKEGGCPIFLFFSVNTSGQFVGVAEMAGPVDFNKTVDYWQLDKWTGCFPVKWHIVKDIPNNILKHITLENNDNKPVTNSRDTQEVKLEQGLQMLKLFKGHATKTSILDDFLFYESRQKLMQEKRSKQQQSQKQNLDRKTTDVLVYEKERDGVNGKPRLLKPFESVSNLSKESSASGLGERKSSEDNGASVAEMGMP